MADRASVSIRIGGRIARADLLLLAELAEAESAYTDYDDTPFDPGRVEPGVLTLVAHEVAWGRLDVIEDFCIERGLPFARWSGSSPGAFAAERVVFTGAGEPCCYAATDDDELVASLASLRELGSMAAIEAHFAAGDRETPPLEIVDERPAPPRATPRERFGDRA